MFVFSPEIEDREPRFGIVSFLDRYMASFAGPAVSILPGSIISSTRCLKLSDLRAEIRSTDCITSFNLGCVFDDHLRLIDSLCEVDLWFVYELI